jgi:hypothetical protein
MKTVLKERATDQAYVGFTKFFRDYLFLQKEQWKVFGPRRYRTYIDVNEKTIYGVAPGFLIYWQGAVDEELYKKYIEISGDTNGNIVPDLESLKNIIGQFSIAIFPRNTRTTADATMSSEGTLNFYMSSWQVPDTFFSSPNSQNANINAPLEYIIRTRVPSVEQVMAELNRYGGLRTILIHELTHYINAIRANGAHYRAKGGVKQFDSRTDQYINSTEEQQARFVENYERFDSFMSRYKLDDLYSDHYNIVYYIATDNAEQFIRCYFWIALAPFENYAQYLTRQNRQRFIKRLYDIFNHYRDTRHPLVMAMAEDLRARSKEPRYKVEIYDPIPIATDQSAKPNMRKKPFTPKTQPRTRPRPEQTIAERFHIVKKEIKKPVRPLPVNENRLTRQFLSRIYENVDAPLGESSYKIDSRYIDDRFSSDEPRYYRINLVRGDCLAKQLGSNDYVLPDNAVLELVSYLQSVAPQHIRELDRIINIRDLHIAYKDSREKPNPS